MNGMSTDDFENAMRQMSGGGQQQRPAKGAVNNDGEYQHQSLRKDINRHYEEVVMSEAGEVAHAQNLRERTGAKDFTPLHKDLDPRTFEDTAYERDTSQKMVAFFRDHTIGKFDYLDVDSPFYPTLVNLLARAPVREPKNASYLHYALANPDWGPQTKRIAIRTMMEYNFDPNREWNSEFPIERAVRLGDPQVVVSLLQYGATATAVDKRGYNLVSQALESGNPKLIPLLARYRVAAKPTAAGDSPLTIAVARFKETVKDKPSTAYTTLFESIANLNQCGMLYPGHKTGEPLLDIKSREYKDILAVKEAAGDKHDVYFSHMMDALNGLPPFDTARLGLLQKATPARIEPFTNEGAVHVVRPKSMLASFVSGPKGWRDNLQRANAEKKTKDIFKVCFDLSTTDAEFVGYARGCTHGPADIPVGDAHGNHAVDANGKKMYRAKSFFHEYVSEIRHSLNLDQPHTLYPHDTLIHRACRIGSPAMLDFCMHEECNLHVVNSDGDYPLHLISQINTGDEVEDTRSIKTLLTKMLGTINPNTGMRTNSLYEPGKIADMRALNANGETFLEVLSRTRGPEFAHDIAAHLELSAKRQGDLDPAVIDVHTPVFTMTPPPPPLLETNIVGAGYLNIDPNAPFPPRFTATGHETAEEEEEFYRKKLDAVHKLTAMLDSPTLTPERKAQIDTELAIALSTTPPVLKMSMVLNTVDKLSENMNGSEELNRLRQHVYTRVIKNLYEELKDPAVALAAFKELEHKTPEGTSRADVIMAGLVAVNGSTSDKNPLNHMSSIIKALDEARTTRYANAPEATIPENGPPK